MLVCKSINGSIDEKYWKIEEPQLKSHLPEHVDVKNISQLTG